jgi:DMSO/TMAO reductase YedYZ molybdopterin-dependent catalytic subunit
VTAEANPGYRSTQTLTGRRSDRPGGTDIRMTPPNDERRPVWEPTPEPENDRPTTTDPTANDTAGARPRPPDSPADPGRRRLIVRGLGLVAGAALAGGLGKYALDRLGPGSSAATAVPTAAGPTPSPILAASTVSPLTAAEQLSAPGLTALVTASDRFYRIDTASNVPVVDVSTWQLKISGMVDRPRTYGYAELAAMPLFEQYVTIACVSNNVGGGLIGNALWTGIRLKEILATAGVQQGATQIVGRSVDGFTVGFPTSWALDPSREPMVVLGMNREPLPAEHGYPARLIVPGLYGYVSATKWLSEIELTTREAFDGYWIPLGWDKDGPILTEARIDHPGYLDKFPAGSTWVDGMAWAPDRGISRVEVRIDDGPWNQAETSRAISKAAWVQWMWQWQATPGDHTIRVRATDGNGELQTDVQSLPMPNGATGYPSIQVTVT